jgi:hypothetical protein
VKANNIKIVEVKDWLQSSAGSFNDWLERNNHLEIISIDIYNVIKKKRPPISVMRIIYKQESII